MHARDCPRAFSAQMPTPLPDDSEAAVAPLSLTDEPDEPSELDIFGAPFTDDDSRWDAFIPDDDEFDPLPEPGDFWTTQD